MPYVMQQDVASEEMAMGAQTPIVPDEVVVSAIVTAEFSFKD